MQRSGLYFEDTFEDTFTEVDRRAAGGGRPAGCGEPGDAQAYPDDDGAVPGTRRAARCRFGGSEAGVRAAAAHRELRPDARHGRHGGGPGRQRGVGTSDGDVAGRNQHPHLAPEPGRRSNRSTSTRCDAGCGFDAVFDHNDVVYAANVWIGGVRMAGLFARRRINAGTILGEYVGAVVSRQRAGRRDMRDK